MTDLARWLAQHQLERYLGLLRDNEVDLATLKLLTDGDLRELGLPFGPRKRLIAALAAEAAPAPAPAPPAPAPPAATPGERRHLTVMFCDMVGFTEAAHRLDPEALQAVVRQYEDACRACVERFEGYVFTMLGDGVVAFFGYPLAHEGEAQRAIHAGLAIIDTFAHMSVPEVGRIEVRIGIAAGILVVAPGERNAVGETMNLASRLQTYAAPGQIVVNERVLRNAGGEFDYQPLGRAELKGIAGQTPVYRITGLSAARTRFDAAQRSGPARMIGRAAESRRLREGWEEVLARRSGRAILVSGEAGIGKSRIVAELRERIGSARRRIMVCQCQPFYSRTAFYPIIDGLEHLLGFTRDTPAADRLERIIRLVAEAGMPAEDARFIAALLSMPYEHRLAPLALSPKLAKSETVRVLAELVCRNAGERPFIILVEDLHWADPTTIEALGELIGQLEGCPLLLLLTARPEFTCPWEGAPRFSAVPLTRLSAEQSEALIAGVTGGLRLPPAVAEAIVAKSDGVPLFIEELTRSVLESGGLVPSPAGDALVLAGDRSEIVIPDSLRESLTARLDRAAEVKAVAQVGAAIGREFGYEMIAATGLVDEAGLAGALGRLVESGLAFVRGRPPASVYTFRHALIQDVAYDSLLKSERRTLNARIAAIMAERWPELAETQPEILAHHHTNAGDAAAAVPLWLRAGRMAIARFAVAEASAHLRQGLQLARALAPSPERDQLELALRTVLGPVVVAGHGWAHPEVARVLEPAWELAQATGHLPAYVPVLNALWVHSMTIDRLGASLGWADRMIEAGRLHGEDALELTGLRARSGSQFWLGELRGAWETGNRLQALYDVERHGTLVRMTNTDAFTGEGIYRAQYLWMLGYPDQAAAAARATEAHSRNLDHPFDLAFALTLGAQVWELRGEPHELARCTDDAQTIARERGVALLSETLAEISRGIVWMRQGRVEESIGQLGRGIEALYATGHRVWIPYLRALQATGMSRRGEPEEALALIDAHLAEMEAGEQRAHHAEVLRLRARTLLAAGRSDEAEECLHTALAVARRQEARSWELRSAITLARLHDRRGEREAALAALVPVLDWFTEGHDTADLKRAAALRGRLETGAAAEA